MMTPSVKGPGPSREMELSDDHPDAVDIAEKADGPELFFMECARFRDEGDNVLAEGFGPAACALPVIHEGGKAICPGDREGSELVRPPTICSDGLALFHGPEGRTNFIPRDRREMSVEGGGPWGPALPEGGPFGGGLRKPGMKCLNSPLGGGL